MIVFNKLKWTKEKQRPHSRAIYTADTIIGKISIGENQVGGYYFIDYPNSAEKYSQSDLSLSYPTLYAMKKAAHNLFKDIISSQFKVVDQK